MEGSSMVTWGVAIAYPTGAFETLDVDISRLSDKRIGGWPVQPQSTLIESALSTVKPVLVHAAEISWHVERTQGGPLVYVGKTIQRTSDDHVER